jgi:uncharacterized membrane protein YphA (DoxX/SURF4 family)
MLLLDPASVWRVATVWHPATRVAFRFFATYFTLYVLTTQMLQGMLVLQFVDVPNLGELPPVRPLVSSVATHVFRVSSPLVITGSGSGDKTYDWVHAFTTLTLSVLITVLWSALDRRREHYSRLQQWVRLLARFALGSTMVGYGMVKAIPLQMPAPGLTRLLEPFGHFSPMGVLWYSIGASRPYEIFAGCAELAGGILLFIPQTATLGALICLADSIQIFALNMTYDVPVKLFSFHLIVLSLFLLAPEARRLLNVLLLNRPAEPSTVVPLGRTIRARRLAVAAQTVFGAYLVGMNLNSALQSWTQYGGGAAKSPLYGIWTIEQMVINGETRSPLVTDFDRFRRVIFDRPTQAAFQRMNDTFVVYGAQIDTAAKTVTLTRGTAASPGSFSYEQPAPDVLVLNGSIEGRNMRMHTRLLDRNSFLLVTRGFHWVQEYPCNR